MEEFKEIGFTANFNVETNGVEGLKFLLQEGKYVDAPKPDLLVIDLNLPKKNGIEILSEMSKNKNLSDIPVVIFSSASNQKEILGKYKNINYIFITKPNDLNEYGNVIKTVNKFWFSNK